MLVTRPSAYQGKVQVEPMAQVDRTSSRCSLFLKQTKWDRCVCPTQA